MCLIYVFYLIKTNNLGLKQVLAMLPEDQKMW